MVRCEAALNATQDLDRAFQHGVSIGERDRTLRRGLA
jgi:hypothetical protein